MLLKVSWFLVLAVSATLSTSSSSPPSSFPNPAPTQLNSQSTYKPAQPVVYTAETARQSKRPASAVLERRQLQQNANNQPNYYEIEDELSKGRLNSASGANDNYNNEPEDNPGFVDPVDFSSFLADVSRGSKNTKSRDVLNPFVAESRNKDGFAQFFPKANSRDSFEPNFGSLASSASDQNSRKVKDEGEDGFVDPNVQFRSLFDSTETADGFKPQDFLDYQGDSAGADVSKGSQTKAYPQFTYTGRQQDYEDDEAEGDDSYTPARGNSKTNNNPRYRSSYRQVDSSGDPYDDRSYYDGERDRSPSGPAPPPQKYKVSKGQGQGQAQAPAGQESAHAPQASSGDKQKADSPGGKNKCKKVEKLVEENEEYDSFLEPEPEDNYDPSNYQGRYKRQAGGRGKGKANKNKKRPMTCHVCEDEDGRYAERCSYDSKADPKAGNYFHSSSTSFNDNGKRGGSGGRGGNRGERYKRDPSLATSASSQSSEQASAALNITASSPEEPKRLQKRQSNNGRQYASGYPRPGRQQQNNGNRQNEFEDLSDNNSNNNNNNNNDYDEYGRSPYADDAARNEYGFGSTARSPGRGGGGGSGGGRSGGRNEYDLGPPPSYGGGGGGRPSNTGAGRREPEDEEFDSSPDYEGPTESGNRNNNNRRPNNRDRDSSDFDISPGPNYGGSADTEGNSNRRTGNRERGQGTEFDFGAPRDFGRDNGQDSPGFQQYDFAIPKDFDPDVQLGTSNTNNRPIFSGSNANGFGPNDENGYEGFVKEYFPEAFNGPSAGPSQSTTYRPSGPSSSERPAPVYNHRPRTPERQNTHQNHQYSPPPPRQNNNNRNLNNHNQNNDYASSPFGPEENNEDLHRQISSFNQKGDAPGMQCQKVQKGDMTCKVCRDPRGMKKEECIYASNDPKNQQMAYHEVSEYSSLPPASILPAPKQKPGDEESRTSIKQESKKVEVKKLLPIDYDFDY